MRLEIVSRGLSLAPEQREQIERRVRLALGRFGDRVVRAVVRLGAVSRGGPPVEHRCRVTVRMERLGQLVVEGTDLHWSVAVERATLRLGPAVERQLARGFLAAPRRD